MALDPLVGRPRLYRGGVRFRCHVQSERRPSTDDPAVAVKRPLALAVLVVLAGCGGAPGGTDGDTPPGGSPTGATPTDAPRTDEGTPPGESTPPDEVDIPVNGGELPVDHERIYRQVVELVGRSADPPSQIVLVNRSSG